MTLTGVIPALAGANLIYGLGMLDSALTWDYAQKMCIRDSQYPRGRTGQPAGRYRRGHYEWLWLFRRRLCRRGLRRFNGRHWRHQFLLCDNQPLPAGGSPLPFPAPQ